MCCPELSFEHSISALELPSLQPTPQHTYMSCMHDLAINNKENPDTTACCAVQTRKNPCFHSAQTDWCCTDSGTPEPKVIYGTSPGPALPTDATPRTRSVLGGLSPRRGNASGFRPTFEAQGLGAHVARRARTAPPRRRSTPLTGARSFVSRRHKSAEIRYLVPGSSVGNSS